jgi:hypothetical protein
MSAPIRRLFAHSMDPTFVTCVRNRTEVSNGGRELSDLRLPGGCRWRFLLCLGPDGGGAKIAAMARV